VVYTVCVLMLIHTNYFYNEFSVDPLFHIFSESAWLMETCYRLYTCLLDAAFWIFTPPTTIVFTRAGVCLYKGYAADDVEWVMQCYRALYNNMSAQRQSFVCAVTVLSIAVLLIQLQRPHLAFQSVLRFVSLTVIAAAQKCRTLTFCSSNRPSKKLHRIIAV